MKRHALEMVYLSSTVRDIVFGTGHHLGIVTPLYLLIYLDLEVIEIRDLGPQVALDDTIVAILVTAIQEPV